MKNNLRIVIAALVAAACSPPKSATNKTLSIAVIPKGTSHEFWKSIHAGAIQAE